MNQKPRIAVGGILTECNHFGGLPIDIGAFSRYELRRGPEILDCRAGVIAGFLQVLGEQGMTPLPLLFASTCPGGPVTSSCCQQLRDELLNRLSNARRPVDALLLGLHGAMVAEDQLDTEGDLLRRARAVLGVNVPIVVTVDLHAQITREMVENADAIVAWETYPHRDAEATGRRAAQLACRTVAGQIRPTMAMGRVPSVTSGIHGSTEGNGPFAELMRFAKGLEQRENVLSTSLFLGHPYLDLPQMGSGGLVITDNDLDGARRTAHDLALRYWARRHDLEPDTVDPRTAIQTGLDEVDGMVLLVEAADCCGGGAAGDSVHTLRALLEKAANVPSIVPVVDAPAAQVCHEVGHGATVQLVLGHHHDPRWGTPLALTGQVTKLGSGVFTYRGGIWDGVEGNMGPTAVFTVGGTEILIATHATYDWRDEQFRSMGLNIEAAKFVVIKNPMNFHLVYDTLANAQFVLDTPGPTPATLRSVRFERLEHPCFPWCDELPSGFPEIMSRA